MIINLKVIVPSSLANWILLYHINIINKTTRMSRISHKVVSKFLNERNVTCPTVHQYFRDFLSAILNVDEKYLCYSDNICEENKQIVKYILQVERSFTYELYHQWSMLLKKNNPLELMINCEITKYLMSEDHCTAKQPDFVLHEGQDSIDNHILVGEVKSDKYYRSSNERNSAVDDIIKLLKILNGRLHQRKKFEQGPGISYQYAFFLVYNKQTTEEPFFLENIFIENIKKSIDDHKLKKTSNRNIFLIEYVPHEIRIISLNDMLQGNNLYQKITEKRSKVNGDRHR